MVFDRFLKALRQQQGATPPTQAQTPPPGVTPPPAPGPLALPHPEELMTPQATLANTNLDAIMQKWFTDWAVPPQYWDYWRHTIEIHVYDVYPPGMGMSQDTPAGTWEADGRRHLAIKPKWLNPGVIAHEQAHNSYALLTSDQKNAFSTAYRPLINTDPLLKLLYSKNKYGLSNDIEGHAEVYRYIGQYMPTHLKQFYPKLF